MTSADLNDLVPAQEKLEWVTPKISLMEAVGTEGKPIKTAKPETTTTHGPNGATLLNYGPS